MQVIGVRRNIQSLSKEERKQYFWCLKMLGIVPANPQRAKRFFYSRALNQKQTNKQQTKIYPTSIHDQLIANHANCCQHNSYCFGYYHRHLMVYFQLMLNYCHQLLSNGQQFKKNHNQLYGKHQKLFDTVFSQYAKIQKKASKVMAHYWNPTNYNSTQDLTIPIQLSDPQDYPHQLDSMDKLYQAVNEAQVYQLNVAKRWYNDQSKYNHQQFIQQRFGWFKRNPQYKVEEPFNRFLNGQITPRTQKGEKLDNFNLIHSDYINGGGGAISQKRNFDKITKTKKIMNLFNSKKRQSLVILGGRATNSHYFEIDLNKIKDSPSVSQEVQYNQKLPHYQTAYSLFNIGTKKFNKFLYSSNSTNSQTSHNSMHNLNFFSMNDPLFSLTNMLFFLYHSWIDIQLQLRIRLDKQSESKFVQQNLSKIKTEWKLYDYIIDKKFQDNRRRYEEYPIMQWVNPSIKDQFRRLQYQSRRTFYIQQQRNDYILKGLRSKFNKDDVKYGFQSRQYVINNKNNNKLRSSKQLTEIYKKYLQLNAKDFQYYKGFTNYDASYDIQLFQTQFDPTKSEDQRYINKKQLLKDDGTNIPQYLKAMQKQVNLFSSNVYTRVIKAAVEVDYINPQRDQLNQRQIELIIQRLDLFSLVNRNMQIIGQYPNNILNGTYDVHVSFEQLVKKTQQSENNWLDQSQKQYLKKGFSVKSLSIFGKEKNSKNCVNCISQTKLFFVDLGEELFLKNFKLWQYLQKFINLSGVYYDSKSMLPDMQQNMLSNLINLQKGKNKQTFKYLKILNGAAQLQFQFQTRQKNVVFTIQTQVKDFLTGSIRSQNPFQVSQNQQNLRFPKITRQTQQQEQKAIGTSTRTYSRVKGRVQIGLSSQNFSFYIQNYHKLLNLRVIVERINNVIHIRVEDKDHAFKKAFFELQPQQ